MMLSDMLSTYMSDEIFRDSAIHSLCYLNGQNHWAVQLDASVPLAI